MKVGNILRGIIIPKSGILIFFIVYVAINISVMVLFPKEWGWYYGNKKFFFIFQLFLFSIVLTTYTKGFFKWFLRITFSAIIIFYIKGRLPEVHPSKDGNNSEKHIREQIQTKVTKKIQTVFTVRTTPGHWSPPIINPIKGSGKLDVKKKLGYKNIRLGILINDNENLVFWEDSPDKYGVVHDLYATIPKGVNIERVRVTSAYEPAELTIEF